LRWYAEESRTPLSFTLFALFQQLTFLPSPLCALSVISAAPCGTNEDNGHFPTPLLSIDRFHPFGVASFFALVCRATAAVRPNREDAADTVSIHRSFPSTTPLLSSDAVKRCIMHRPPISALPSLPWPPAATLMASSVFEMGRALRTPVARTFGGNKNGGQREQGVQFAVQMTYYGLATTPCQPVGLGNVTESSDGYLGRARRTWNDSVRSTCCL